MKSKEMKYAVAYARFSSDNQRTESIDAQLRAIDDYCKSENYMLVHTYIDEAQSATNDKREQFQQLITDAKNKEFQFVIVHKLDRFSRDRYDSAVYKRQLRNNGIRVISVLERLDNSPESVILESLLEGMSEYYSMNLAREVKKGMKENALKCMHTGGTPPLGYDIDNVTRQFILNEIEADTIRKIFTLYVQDYGYAKIADILNSDGRLTKRQKPFSKNSIRELLLNEKYKGVYVYNKSTSSVNGKRNRHAYKNDEDIIRIPGGVPAIVSIELWDRANSKIGKLTRPRQGVKREYLFTGKIECGKCGSAFIGKSYKYKETERYNYTCNSKLRRTGCDAETILADQLEQVIFQIIYDEFLTDEAINRITEKMQRLIESTSTDTIKLIADSKRKIESCEHKTRKLLDLYYEQAITIADYKEESQKLTTEIKMLQDIVSAYDNREIAYSNCEDIKKFLNDLRTSENKKLLIDTFVDKIIVNQDNVKIFLKDSSSISVKVGDAVLAPTFNTKPIVRNRFF